MVGGISLIWAIPMNRIYLATKEALDRCTCGGGFPCHDGSRVRVGVLLRSQFIGRLGAWDCGRWTYRDQRSSRDRRCDGVPEAVASLGLLILGSGPT